jgi:hypothetical protein
MVILLQVEKELDRIRKYCQVVRVIAHTQVRTVYIYILITVGYSHTLYIRIFTHSMQTLFTPIKCVYVYVAGIYEHS